MMIEELKNVLLEEVIEGEGRNRRESGWWKGEERGSMFTSHFTVNNVLFHLFDFFYFSSYNFFNVIHGMEEHSL